MKKPQLEQKIARASRNKWTKLYLNDKQITILPDSIDSLFSLHYLDLGDNQLKLLPDSISSLSRLSVLQLGGNQLTKLPENIGNLDSLTCLDLSGNQLESLPDSIGDCLYLKRLRLNDNRLLDLPDSIINLSKLTELQLANNPLSDLSILSNLPRLEYVWFLDAYLPRRYWIELKKWKPQWLLDEDNTQIRCALIEQLGYEKICKELNAIDLDNWREYSLLKIDGVEAVYDEEKYEKILDREPMVLLKMTCPSTGHIHILRVPPEMMSAEAAITWVNHGIHPDEFAVQT
jgi:leucine-rich repeat protein SHOC2